MKFVGILALQEAFPNVEVTIDGRRVDLHNQGVLAALSYDYESAEFSIRWSLKGNPGVYPQTPTSVTLVVSGVRSVRCAGEIAGRAQPERLGLDFLEYTAGPGDLGQLRFVLDNDAEVVVTGRQCRGGLLGATRAAG